MPFCFNCYIRLSCNTLSKALDMYRNTSKPLSKEVKISWVIDRGWLTQELPGLNPDCFGKIRLLSMIHYLWYIRKPCCRLEEERLDDIFWCMLPFFKSSGNISDFTQFLKTVKSFFYSVTWHFQHVNTDHAMTMSFVRIEFTNDSFHIFLREFNVGQVLIGNGISWWGKTLLFSITERCFTNKTKEIGLFIEICIKFFVINNRWNARNFIVSEHSC